LSLLKELKRRNVFKVAAAYVIVGWLIMQAGEVMGPALHLPEWVNSLLAFFLILGFPLAMFFAWAYEMTPEGLKKENEVDHSQSVADFSGQKLNYAIMGLLALAVVYFVFDKFVTNPQHDAGITQTTQTAKDEINVEADRIEPDLIEPDLIESGPDEKSIAVLPFDNRSNLEEDQFFTDGIHDDLLTTIAKIGSMKVISRTSVMEYRGTIKKIPQIAQELGVANILEGGIQRSGNQVRINVQLIDAVTDEHLWAEIYDRELTAENLFAVQSEITRIIAEALQAELSTDEKRRIDSRPTDNLLAYEAFMRGRQLMATRNSANLKLATEEFFTATEIDPMFALAWVGVADSHMLLRDVPDEDVYPIIEDAIKNALAIDNDLGEAYASLGLMYFGQRRIDEAETAFQKAIELSPNYANAYKWYANPVGRDPLRRQESLGLMQKAAKLDPRSAIIAHNLGESYRSRGLYTLAESQYKKVIEVHPDFEFTYIFLPALYIFDMGQFDKALALLNKAIELHPEFNPIKGLKSITYIELGDLEGAQEYREELARSGVEEWRLGLLDLQIGFYKVNSAGTLESIKRLLPKMPNARNIERRFLGAMALTQGDIQLSREIFLSVEPRWLEPDQWSALTVGDRLIETGCIVAWLFMNTGDQELGTALLQQTTAYIEDTRPLMTEHPGQLFPETCYLTAGDTEKALLSIETQLAHNHLSNWYMFHQMPMYDRIRFDPRYQAAWAERERRIGVQRENIEKMAGDQLRIQ
jgi:TolB-like protein/Tfp pilus assembly protein PilF